MKSYVALAVAAALAGSANLASADQMIASPPLPGGFFQAGICYVRNVGTTPIVVDVRIVNGAGDALTPDFDNCNDAPLAPGRNCLFFVSDLSNSFLLACSATTAGSAKKLRGTLEVREPDPYLTSYAAELQ